jgi:hypothetical protein
MTCLFVLVGSIVTWAEATDYGWDNGGGDGKWSTSANWAPNGTPDVADSFVHISDNATWNLTVDTDATLSNVLIKADGVAETAQTTYTANWTGDGNNRTIKILDAWKVLTDGNGSEHMYGTAYTYQGLLNVTDVNLQIGSSSTQRGSIVIGTRVLENNIYSLFQGTLRVTRGSFAAWLTSVTLGRSDQLEGGDNPYGMGTLDLGGCNAVTMDVSGDFNMAYCGGGAGGYRRFAYGNFICGGGAITVGNLQLADPSVYRAYEARMWITNTTFAVTNRALFHTDNNTANGVTFAQVYATASGRCSGLDLRDSSDALYIRNANDADAQNVALIAVKFTADPTATGANQWYWGMRWKGDRESALETYRGHTYPELTIDVSGLSDNAKFLHLAYLKKLRPGTYGSYTGIGDLVPNDYITYDSSTGYTYVGVHYELPAGTLIMMR